MLSPYKWGDLVKLTQFSAVSSHSRYAVARVFDRENLNRLLSAAYAVRLRRELPNTGEDSSARLQNALPELTSITIITGTPDAIPCACDNLRFGRHSVGYGL
jgi:hypothetical protein